MAQLSGRCLRRVSDSRWAPVSVAVVVSVALQGLWIRFLASSGGDLAAQDAWAGFARAHPGSAYNLAWYGGMHPVSYSAVSPFVMAGLGVRTTMVVTSTVAVGLLAWLLTSRMTPGWSRFLPVVVGAFAFLGNAASGRATFALGTSVGLAAVCVVFAWPVRRSAPVARTRRVRGAMTAALSAAATACSPVSGLFLGVAATALWTRGRRAAAYTLGVPVVLVVVTFATLFPFAGQQPMEWSSALLPTAMGVAVVLLVPREWRDLRVGACVYLALVAFAWAAPTQIGTNVTRLALLFGGVILVAAAVDGRWRSSLVAARAGAPVAAVLLGVAVVTSVAWQVSTAVRDVVDSRPAVALDTDVGPLVNRLRAAGANLGRVEVVPTRSHREAAALTPYVVLARGWNRQADVEQNPIFYGSEALTEESYLAWLRRWGVRFVVLATTAEPDLGAHDEAQLVRQAPSYLDKVWSNPTWTIYSVVDPEPLVRPAATVEVFDAEQLTVTTPKAGRYIIKIAASPWLNLGNVQRRPLGTACLSDLDTDYPMPDGQSHTDNWVVLHAPAPGTYRIAAPYKLPRGTPCNR
jgi:hypothetical protein